MRRRLPKKHEILKKARDISTERAVIQGLPAITPTEAELKETGVYHEARIGLMRGAESEGYAQQHKYVAEMASEMGLALLRKREHREQLRKVHAFDIFRGKHPTGIVKVNGYKIVVPTFQKPKVQPKQPRMVVSKAPVKPKRKKKDIPMGMFGPISIPKTRKYRVTKPVSDWKIGQIVDMPTNVDTHSLIRRGFLAKWKPPQKAKPKRKKRQKLHVERSGKSMRKLRKQIKNGKKVFAFPDDVWKVRKI